MAKEGFLESVNIPVPCEKDWEKMAGDEQKRYCSGCEKNVYNISAIPRQAAKKLLAQNTGSLCIRYARLPNGQVMTADRKLHQISRRSSAIAAGVLAATLTLSAMTQAQQSKPAATSLPSAYAHPAYQAASIILTVSDEMNAVIPGAQVTLTNQVTKKIFSMLTNEEGDAPFSGIPDGKYLVKAAGLGFAEYHGIVEVNNQKKSAITITLKVNREFLMGDVVTAELPVSSQKEKSVESKPNKKNQTKDSSETSQISFTVSDPNGAVIPSIQVDLTNQKTKAEFSALTDQDGVAQFNMIPRGRYDLLATSSAGFMDYKQVIQIKEPIEPNIKLTLQAPIMGEISINRSEIPLFQAIAQEDNKTVKQVITSGFDVNTKDNAKRTALHIAVEHENLEMVRFLLEKGAKVNARDQAKRTPILMLQDNLSEENSIEILKLLVAHGSDVNLPGEDKSTLLMQACEDDNLEVVKILLEAKADPNLKDEDGETALEKTDSDEIKRLLQSYGAR